MPPYNSMPQGGAFGKPQQGGFGQPPMRQPLPMQPQMGGPNPMATTPPAYGGMTPLINYGPTTGGSQQSLGQPSLGGMPQKDFTPYYDNMTGGDRPFTTGVYNGPFGPDGRPEVSPYEPFVTPPSPGLIGIAGILPGDDFATIQQKLGITTTPMTQPTMPTQPIMPLPMPTQMPQTLPTQPIMPLPMPTQMPQTQPTMPTMLPTFPQQYNGPGKQGGLSQVQQGGPRRPLPYPPVMG